MTAAGAPYPKVDDRAPCRHGDPDRFHQPGHPPEGVLEECAGCPFHDPCLAYAVVHDVSGVWGGKTTAERRRIRKERGIVPVPVQFGLVSRGTGCGTNAAYQRHIDRGETPCERCRVAAREYRRSLRAASA